MSVSIVDLDQSVDSPFPAQQMVAPLRAMPNYFDTLIVMSLEQIEELDATEGPAATAGVSPAHALARLTRHLEQVLSEVHLTLPHYRLLIFLEKQSDAAHRLATQLHVRPPSLTALVDGMVSRSLVDRSADPDDRRRVRIVITEEGQRLLRLADTAAIDRLRDIQNFDPGRDDLVDSLGDWQDALAGSLHERLTS